MRGLKLGQNLLPQQIILIVHVVIHLQYVGSSTFTVCMYVSVTCMTFRW